MLRLLRRLVPSRRAAVVAVPAAEAGATCALSACGAGTGATVLEVRCGDQEACRLRALGLCEGARVDVVDARHAVLLEVRGTRIAIGRALSAGITVRPLLGGADAAPRRPFLPAAPMGAAGSAAAAAALTTSTLAS
ncbi:MAG TPA: FeoA family protein [Gemmatirosa sp.]|nr:FeoA family protein [Gemmatirosa sp.]